LDLLIPRIDITFKVLGRKDIAFSKYGVYPFIVYSDLTQAQTGHISAVVERMISRGTFLGEVSGAVIVNSEVGRYIIIFGEGSFLS